MAQAKSNQKPSQTSDDINMDILETRTYHVGRSVTPRAMKDDEGREYYDFELSNEQVDSHGTIFRMDGARIDEFNADPVVSYGHPWMDSTDPDDVIGTGQVRMEDGKLMARLYLEEGDDNVKAKKVRTKLKQDIIRSCSLVAYINDYSRGKSELGEDPNVIYFRDWTLLMWGVVMKGSNSNAKRRTAQRVMAMRTELGIETNAENAIIDEFHTHETSTETDDDIDSTLQRQLSLLTESRIALAKVAS